MRLLRYSNLHCWGILCAKDRAGENAVGRFILIGDHKQLPAVVMQSSDQSRIVSEDLVSVGVTKFSKTPFRTLYRYYAHDPEKRVVDMLCTQGRMNPAIALFPNKLSTEVSWHP